MAEITVTAETGRPTGSRASSRLRAEGKVPGVVYGLGSDSLAVAVPWRELRHAVTGEAGMNALIDLHVGSETPELVMVKELQRHPVRRDVLHVDFLRVSRDQELSVEVPIHVVGEATQVFSQDGMVDQVLFHLTVTAKPQSIPNELTLDVSGLTLGDTLRVSDLTLPADVTTPLDPEEPVVTTSVAAVSPEDEQAAAEEIEAAEAGLEPVEGEGEAAPAEAGGGEGGETAAE